MGQELVPWGPWGPDDRDEPTEAGAATEAGAPGDRPTAVDAGAGPEPPWGYLDQYLWYTCDILSDHLAGTLDARPMVATTARLRPGERPLAVGPAFYLTWRAVGDGSWTHSGVVAFGHPALVAGTLIGSAMGNAARRRAAQAAVRPRWVPEASGEVVVSDLGFHFLNPVAAAYTWDWGTPTSMEMVGPERLQCGFVGGNGGHVAAQLHTPWASLIFVLTALHAFPAHPRLLSCAWLPPGFEARCARLGYPLRFPDRLRPAGPTPA
ncbi:hypothetical protein [Streptomyces radicis]|uniref:Uncharacterized protein n=1 Tax=Streptomyces radicis TaxID=1750517 RepID=A0A3A9WH94_9ACTN|nr:hypothetical protein [Streptomyces radicis]RKN11972.1 hypothetical protein D7319_03435 [Streptomyces radicis]RKN25976.1 hypothetical protein D7318_07045 [Streptomyces radicis]